MTEVREKCPSKSISSGTYLFNRPVLNGDGCARSPKRKLSAYSTTSRSLSRSPQMLAAAGLATCHAHCTAARINVAAGWNTIGRSASSAISVTDSISAGVADRARSCAGGCAPSATSRNAGRSAAGRVICVCAVGVRATDNATSLGTCQGSECLDIKSEFPSHRILLSGNLPVRRLAPFRLAVREPTC